ncbi:hypothetical protein CR513_47888, partial [Mucuna pruriens]
MAELWMVYEGLRLAKRSIKGDSTGSEVGWILMREICSVFDSDWRFEVLHIFSEANESADLLANLACV